MNNLSIALIITAVVCSLGTLAMIVRMLLKEEFPNSKSPINALKELEYTGLDAFAYDTELHLCSKRAQKILMDLNIDSPGKLSTLTTDKLLAIKGCGPSTVREIKLLAIGFDIFIA